MALRSEAIGGCHRKGWDNMTTVSVHSPNAIMTLGLQSLLRDSFEVVDEGEIMVLDLEHGTKRLENFALTNRGAKLVLLVRQGTAMATLAAYYQRHPNIYAAVDTAAGIKVLRTTLELVAAGYATAPAEAL